MTRLNPCHYFWPAEADGQHWAYCYCAWTSPRFGVPIDAIKAGKVHIEEVKFPFLEEGIATRFEVVSEFIGCGVDPSRLDESSEPDAKDTWTVDAQTEDGEVYVVIKRDAGLDYLWRASDGVTGVEFMVGNLRTVVSAAAGVIRRARGDRRDHSLNQRQCCLG